MRRSMRMTVRRPRRDREQNICLQVHSVQICSGVLLIAINTVYCTTDANTHVSVARASGRALSVCPSVYVDPSVAASFPHSFGLCCISCAAGVLPEMRIVTVSIWFKTPNLACAPYGYATSKCLIADTWVRLSRTRARALASSHTHTVKSVLLHS